MNLKLVAIDWAKRSFQLCGISTAGKVLFNHKVSRVLLLKSGRHLAAWLAVCHDNTAPGGMSNCMASPKMATAAGEPCSSTAHVR